MPDGVGPSVPSEPRNPRSRSSDSSTSQDSAVSRDSSESLDGVPPQVGDFRLLRRLGKGGMAEVFLAEQVSLKRNVAVKILRKENITDEAHVKRFEREAMAAGGLSHPNIVQVYSIGEEQGAHYIAQEYVAGHTLRDLIARKGPPEVNVALRIIRQVASALQAANDAGIVHRDIKPENILLTKKGEVKVADFGLAQLTQGGERLDLTRENTTLGTPMYMSPEQVNGSKLDHRSDLYSLGVTCYHLLSGSPPFNGETALAVAVKHLHEQAEPLEKVRPDLPLPLCRIVQKLMAKKVEQRYQSAQALIKDLKRLKQQDEAAEEEGEPTVLLPTSRLTFTQAMSRRLDKPLGSQLAWFVGLGLLLMATGAGLGWAARTKNPFEAPVRAGGPEAVEKKKDAKDQFFLALRNPGNPAYWEAVRKYFPSDRRWWQKAEEKLALLYVRDGKFTEAQGIFNEFSTYSSADPEKVAFGQAGKAYFLTREGKYDESQRLLDKVEPHLSKLDEHMREIVIGTLRRNMEQLKTQADEKWQKVLNDTASPPPEPQQ